MIARGAPVRPRSEAKGLAARALDRAARRAGRSHEQLGAELGVSAQRAARLRDDDERHLDVAPSVADLLLARHDLFEQLLAEVRAARATMHEPARERCVTRAVFDAVAVMGRLAAELASELATSGSVPRHRHGACLDLVLEARAALDALDAALRAGLLR